MKKVLFTSTALVAFTGAAAADVTLSGRAEMGIFQADTVSTGALVTANDGAQFFTDIDVTFTMTGETDNGLTFGASVDLDEGGAGSAAVANNTDDGGATIFISGGFGTVTMGDTDGALDWALTEAGNVGNGGSIADDETAHSGYNGSYLDGGNDGQILRWDYSVGDFGIAVSIEDDNGANAANTNVGYAIGLKYNLDLGGTTVALGLGHQEAADSVGVAADAEATGVSATATFANGLSVGVVYTDFDNRTINSGGTGGTPHAVDSHVGVGIGYTTGALTLHANYGEFSGDAGAPDVQGYGVSAAYDLGGGAVVHFGYGSGDFTNAAGTAIAGDADTVSLGLGLSF